MSLAALFFQAVPPLLLWAISTLDFAEPHGWPEARERAISLLALGVSVVVSLGLGGGGAYGLLTRVRPFVAWSLVGFCCTPAIVGGVVYLHALLVFLAWV